MPQSATDKQLADRIERDFSSHTVGMDKDVDMKDIRSKAKMLALDIALLCPDGREKSLALTKLEEAVFWANAGIARG